jgi:hypothetical protein
MHVCMHVCIAYTHYYPLPFIMAYILLSLILCHFVSMYICIHTYIHTKHMCETTTQNQHIKLMSACMHTHILHGMHTHIHSYTHTYAVSHNCFYYTSKKDCALPDDNHTYAHTVYIHTYLAGLQWAPAGRQVTETCHLLADLQADLLAGLYHGAKSFRVQ